MLTAIFVVAAAAIVALLTVAPPAATATSSAQHAAAANVTQQPTGTAALAAPTETDTARDTEHAAAPSPLTVFLQKLVVYALLAASGSLCALALVVTVDILDSAWVRAQWTSLCKRSRVLARLRATTWPVYASDSGKELFKRFTVRAFAWAKNLWDALTSVGRSPPLVWHA